MTNKTIQDTFWNQQIRTGLIVLVGVILGSMAITWLCMTDLDPHTRQRGLLMSFLIPAVIAPISIAFAIHQNSLNLRLNLQIQRLADSDDLTGLANRRCFTKEGVARLDAAHASGTQTALLLVDIDYFKRVNDQYGHEAGDEVLCHVAQTLLHAAPHGAVVARLGGEEFTVMCDVGTPEDLNQLAETLRQAVEATHLRYRGETIRVTISLGLALAQPGDTLSGLLSRADKALYAAKHHGRNRSKLAA